MWEKLNRERGLLIAKAIDRRITEAEQVRLEELQWVADQHQQAGTPRDCEVLMEAELAAIRQQLAAAEAREAVLREALKHASGFIAEELETRGNSFLPDPSEDEFGYLEAARLALVAVQSALSAPSPRAETLLKVAEAAGRLELLTRENSLYSNVHKADAWIEFRAALAAWREAR